MSDMQETNELCCGHEIYEIRVQGHLKDRWTKWFEFMNLSREEDGTTTLYGRLQDQTALHSILLRIRNMNIKLISVRQVNEDSDDEKIS